MGGGANIEIGRGDGQLRLALTLAEARTPSAIAQAVARWGAAASDAEFANLALLDKARGLVRVVHSASLERDIADRWTEFSIDVSTPLSDSIRSSQPVLLGSLDEYVGRYDGLISDTRAAGLQATASLPLRSASGEVLGAIGFAWTDQQTFPSTPLARLGLIARLTSRALEKVSPRAGDIDPAPSRTPPLTASTVSSAAVPDDRPHGDPAEIIAGWVIDFLEYDSPPHQTVSLAVLFDRLDRSGWAITRKQ